jgi:predicted nucleic acid-binding protein
VSAGLRYLLDTNILSETRKRQVDSRVTSFLQNAEPSALYVSVLTLGELRKGVAQKKRSDPSPDAARKIGAWVDGLEFSFADRILGIDAAAARLWGEWSAERPRPVIDTLLAATAVVHGLTLVTRNTDDVRDLKVKLLNPWDQR